MQDEQRQYDNEMNGLPLKSGNIREILREVQAGEEWLARQAEPDVPPEVLSRIESNIREHLDQSVTSSRSFWLRYLVPIAAVIAIAVLVLAQFDVKSYNENPPAARGLVTDNPDTNSPVFDNDLVLWEMAISRTSVDTGRIDEEVMTEVMLLLEDDEDIHDIFGKEISDENYC